MTQTINTAEQFSFRFGWFLRVPQVVYISYNTGTCALPDIYALALGRCAPSGIVHIYQAKPQCPRASCIYISGKALLPVL